MEIIEAIELLSKTHKLNVQRTPQKLSLGSYEECKNMFINAFQETDQSIQKFSMLPEYEEVIRWMEDNQGKGLLLMGSVGRGKTVIVKGVIPVVFLVKKMKVIKPIDAVEMATSPKIFDKYPFVAVDDIGTEPIANDFGVKFESFNRVIESAESNLKLCFLSTNLTSEQLLNRYGERTVDRLRRLCKIIKFNGESLR